VRISYGMRYAVGRLGLDQCRERINIWLRFLSSKLTYEVTSRCKSTPKFLAGFFFVKGLAADATDAQQP
jgi:hypothetical protein